MKIMDKAQCKCNGTGLLRPWAKDNPLYPQLKCLDCGGNGFTPYLYDNEPEDVATRLIEVLKPTSFVDRLSLRFKLDRLS